MDFISKFLTHIVNAGIIPRSTKDVTPCDAFGRIPLQGAKGSKRDLAYWLILEHDFAYGYAKDFKTGIETSFNSHNKDLDKADLTRVKAMIKARKAEEEVKIALRHAKIAERAKVKWNNCESDGSTPYLEKKSIDLLSARIMGSNVFVPIYDYDKDGDRELVSWQIIKPDGVKRFPFGGKKKGCFHTIGTINPTEPIIICEGFATGASIHMATGFAVVVACDAGNLVPVSKKIRSIYKNTAIIVAADNDASITGEKFAKLVKKLVTNSNYVMPKEIGTDYNDVTPEVIKNTFGVQGVTMSHGEDSNLPDLQSAHGGNLDNNVGGDSLWMSNLILDNKGRLVTSSLQNIILYLIYHDDFKGVFSFDEFKQSIVITSCPPWEHEEKFEVSNLTDIIITQTAATLERYGLSSSIERTAKAINVVAEQNKFHSAKRYFESLEWDGVERLGGLFKEHFGSTSEGEKYLEIVGKKWLTAAVKRIMEPGCKFDHVLILESKMQGLYKSQALKTLSTFGGVCYHTDSIKVSDCESQYTPLKMQGVLIVELAELTGFSQKDDNSIKNWITQVVDEVKLPFDRFVSKFKRQFIFTATTNNYSYLKDPTGNRRYWPVTVEKYIDIDELKLIKEQLWAEAVHLYKDGFYIGMTPEENDLAEVERNKRLSQDAWEDIVMGVVNSLEVDEFKVTDVVAKMELRMNEKNDKTVKRVANILNMNGYENNLIWNSKLKKPQRMWSLVD